MLKNLLRWQRFSAICSSLTFALLLTACSDGNDSYTGVIDPEPADPNVIVIEAGENFESDFKSALISAQPGNVIVLPAGEFAMTSAASLDVNNVTIRGQGRDSTLLNFSGQLSGGESLLIVSDNTLVEDLAVIDPPADGIKHKGSNGVTLRNVRVEWTSGASEDNGAYGIYPVQTKNVLIEDSVVIGASDAGIYVGQSDNIIVRRNRVSLNVAGIEIENSGRSDVYENIAEDNTGGILVFDLPNLSRDGAVARVFNNTVRHNNTKNFAPAGNIVGVVPTGTGMLAMAFDDVEIFDNVIEDNQSVAITVVSYEISGLTTDDPDYDPYPRSIYIHDNQYSNNSYDPQDLAKDVADLFSLVGEPIPQIVYDGLGEVGVENVPDAERICVQEASDVTMGYVFSASGLPATGSELFDCAHASLPEVVLDTPDEIEEGEAPPTEEEIAALCNAAGDGVNFDAGIVNCPTLSAYRLFNDAQEPRFDANGGVHYDLITPLFSDYAAKYRFIYLPQGVQAAYAARDSFDFPVGSIIAKTFSMPNDFLNPGAGEDIIETRLLIHRENGWAALPYIWREDGSDADLSLGGGTRTLEWIHSDGSTRTTEYVIPDGNACKVCHGGTAPADQAGVVLEDVDPNSVLGVIGLKARFTNRDNLYDGETVNQLLYLSQQGLLAGVPDDLEAIDTVPDWEDTAADLQNRAKGYLDINCAHCHNPKGFASNSALSLDYWRPVDTDYGLCKPPVAAGAGSGGLSYSIEPGSSDSSIMVFRMDSNDSAVRMPEIGRSLIHTEGVALVAEWVNSLSGACE